MKTYRFYVYILASRSRNLYIGVTSTSFAVCRSIATGQAAITRESTVSSGSFISRSFNMCAMPSRGRKS